MIDKIEAKIKEIQGKPPKVREMYVWGAVGIVMVIMMAIWVMTFTENMRKTRGEVDKVIETINRESEETPSISEMNMGDGKTGAMGR